MKAEIRNDSTSACVGNEEIEFEIDWGSGLRLTRLLHGKTERNWIPVPPDYAWGTDDHREALIAGREGLWPDLAPPSSEFELAYSPCPEDPGLVDPTERELAAEGQLATSRDRRIELSGLSPCTLVPERCAAVVEGGVARLELTVALEGHPLEVTVHTEVPEGLAVARRWATVRNVGAAPVLLHRLSSLRLSVRPGYADLDLYWIEVFSHDNRLWRQSTVHQERITANVRRTLLSGAYSRPHDGSNGAVAWSALRDPVLDEGLFLAPEWSGVFDTEIGDFREGAGVFGVRAGFSDEGDYARMLAPGEIFATPKVLLGFFTGDVEEAGRTTRTVAEQLFGLPWPEGRAPIFMGYDTWCNWQEWGGLSTNHLRPEGLDTQIERAAGVGAELFILDYDWFPRMGDWWSDPQRFPEGVETISAQVKAAGMKFGLWMGLGQVHQDSQVAREHPEWLVTQDGAAITGGWGLRALCLAYPPCRDWVLEQASRVIEQYGVEWLKHDFDLIPISDAHHHAPGATDTRIESVLGFYYIMEGLHERFPGLYLDNWTPATGGADLGNFQRHHSTMLCDWYSAVTVRSALHGLSHLLPPQRTHAYLRMFSAADERSPYHYRSGSFGNGMYLLNDPLLWDEATMAVARQELERLKQDRDLFRSGEVYTLIPKQPDHFGWEARFVYSRAEGRGMAQVFRNHDPSAERQVIFRGLEAEASYEVRFVDAGQNCVAPGSELMTTGVSVRLSSPFSSEILRLRRRES
jgi:alpha-galactosidase